MRSEVHKAVTEDYLLQRCDAVYCARNLLKFSEIRTAATTPTTDSADRLTSTALRVITFQMKVILGKYAC